MSLSIAFRLAQVGLGQAEKKMAVVSSNINNADVAGYTRKTYQSNYTTVNGITTPIGGKAVQAVVNNSLAKSLVAQNSLASKQQTLADYYSDYSDAYGGTSDTSTTLSSSLDSLMSALQALSSTPTDTTSASQIISAAQMLASQIKGLSNNVQQARTQASDAIAGSVTTINTQLKNIADLNRQITKTGGLGMSTADLEDQRNTALQTLSQQIGVQYSINDQNQLSVYSSSGALLVGSTAAQLEYVAPSQIGAGATYPGGIPPITLNGADITGELNTGNLGALVSLRDSILPAEQDKLDTFASTLMTTANNSLADGSAVPAPTTLTGAAMVNDTDVLSASGTWRVAVVDGSNNVQSFADLDLSSYATVGDLVTALNGISGVSASIDADGHLSIQSTDGSMGIALNSMDSNVGGQSASAHFGFNALFTGSGANTIGVSTILQKNPTQLATATLSADSALAVGERGLSSGDSSAITALTKALDSAQSFASAGDFSARSSTLSGYAAALLSNAASKASNAQSIADVASTSYSYLSDKLSNQTGVNIDEETANMTQIQASYEASATLLSTIRSMFSTLIQAMQ